MSAKQPQSPFYQSIIKSSNIKGGCVIFIDLTVRRSQNSDSTSTGLLAGAVAHVKTNREMLVMSEVFQKHYLNLKPSSLNVSEPQCKLKRTVFFTYLTAFRDWQREWQLEIILNNLINTHVCFSVTHMLYGSVFSGFTFIVDSVNMCKEIGTISGVC